MLCTLKTLDPAIDSNDSFSSGATTVIGSKLTKVMDEILHNEIKMK